MPFDWQAFLSSRHIRFVTSGPNISRDELGVKCPFCRDDPSEHMAISRNGRGWSCRRNRAHGGKSEARLVAALINCTMEQAHGIVGTRRHLQSDVFGTVTSLLRPAETEGHKEHSLKWPPEFKSFREKPTYLEESFTRYLQKRGFDYPHLLSFDYGLRFALRGDFAYRIVFPVVFNDRLVNWTARTISDDHLRYKTLGTNKEKARPGEPLGIGPISDYLLWYDDLMDIDCDTIVLVEGPFDALKVNVLGWNEGVCSTCFFTTSPSAKQIELLHSLLPHFKRRYLLQDVGAEARAMNTNATLSALHVKRAYLPPKVGDPGDLTQETWRGILD